MAEPNYYITVLLIVCAITVCYCASNSNNVTPGRYKIENSQDQLYLTTQGSNSSFATVVTENYQNFGEQRWDLVKLAGAGGYHLLPLRYKSNNFLSYYRDAAKKYPIPETWNLIEISAGKYQMQNHRTKLCLVSAGRRKVVLEVKCDRHLRIQQWTFKKV